MEENKNVSKNSWKRIFKKKWFYPAVYLAVAALMLTGVLWYQNSLNDIPEVADDMEKQLNNHETQQDEEDDATTVMQQQETLKMPVTEDLQVEIVTKFYDYSAEAEEQEQGLILHQNKFYQSDGIAISSSEQEGFDVAAALSGQVTEAKQDPLLGNVVKMEHEHGVSTYYASLAEILVEEGNELKQGQSIGTAGENAMGQDNGIHVHFEVRKDGTPVNPENFINQPISKIVAPNKTEDKESETKEETTDEPPTTDDEADKQEPSTKEPTSEEEEADETEQG